MSRLKWIAGDRYIDRRSRTHDQMVQAGRPGVQNIAEGSEAVATSSKIELKLTQAARAGLEDLKLDYPGRTVNRLVPSFPRRREIPKAPTGSVCREAQGNALDEGLFMGRSTRPGNQ